MVCYFIYYNYGWNLNCLDLGQFIVYDNIDVLFLVIAFKGEINYYLIMDSVGIRVPARQIREFCAFGMSIAL
jgi:hypothetical protein